MAAGDINVYGKLIPAVSDGVLAETDAIKDKNLNKFQDEINQELYAGVGGGVIIPQKEGPVGIPFDGQRCITHDPASFKFGDYIGMNGAWVPTWINSYKNDGKLHILRLESYDLMVENCFRVFGGGFSGSTMPPNYVGAFYKLERNTSDEYENYKNGSLEGDASFGVELDGFKCLYCAEEGDYFTSENGDETMKWEDLLRNDVPFTVSAWFRISVEGKNYIIGGGAALSGLSIFVDTDKKVKATFTLDDHVFRTIVVNDVTVNTEEWHRVVFVYDRDNVLEYSDPSVTLFVDSMSHKATYLLENQETFATAASDSILTCGAAFDVVSSTVETDVFNNTRTDIYSQTHPQSGYVEVNYNGVGNNGGAFLRSIPHTTFGDGKSYYWEVTIPELLPNSDFQIGFIEGDVSQVSGLGTYGIVLMNVGQILDHGARIYYTGDDVALAQGDVIGFQANSDGSVAIYKNGTLLQADFAHMTKFTKDIHFGICMNGPMTELDCNFTHFQNQPANTYPLPVGGSSSQDVFQFASAGNIFVRRFYVGPEVDISGIKILLATSYFQAIFENFFTKQRYVLDDIYAMPPKKDDEMSVVIPYPDVLPNGIYDFRLATAQGETDPVRCNVLIPEHVVETVDLDFTDESDLLDYFYSTHKSWGGSSGGCVTQNIHWEPGEVTFEAHGDLYDGDVQGVDRMGQPLWHTDIGDPNYGKPWVTRVGACIQTKQAMGFGSYEVNFKLVGENNNPFDLGVCAAIWTFFYDEEYTTSPFYEEIVAEGIIPQGSDNDGFYVVRNHEIDIELPSHLDGGTKWYPSWQNMKCNSWIGELGSGDDASIGHPGEEYVSKLTPIGFGVNDGEYHNIRFDWYPDHIDFYVDDVFKQTVDKCIPDIPGHMTIGLWFPSAPCVYTIDPGQPTEKYIDCPWWVRHGWAGGDEITTEWTDPVSGETEMVEHQIANWGTQKMVMNHFKFTPFTEYDSYNRDKGESFPFGTVRNIVGQVGSKRTVGPGARTAHNTVETPTINVRYVYKWTCTNVQDMTVNGQAINIPQDGVVELILDASTAHVVASKPGYVTHDKTYAGINSIWQGQEPNHLVTLELEQNAQI